MSIRFGLDVGRRSVKLVSCESSRKSDEPPRTVRSASRDIPLELDGDAKREALVAAIRECAVELGALGREVAVAVPRSESVVKTVHLPPVSIEERGKLIRFQAAKDVPFELTDCVLASGVVGESTGDKSKGSTEVLYAAVRTTVVENLRLLVRSAGLKPGVLEVSTQAAARAVRLLMPDATDAVLVQIGALATDISVFHKGKLAFSRSASVGHLRSVAETGAAEAERWIERLVAEVQRSMRAAIAEGEHPTVLLVAGGGASGDVVPTLATRLGLPVRVVDPTGQNGSPALLVARGLADPRSVPGIPVLDLAGRADAEQAFTQKRKVALMAGLAIALIATIGVLLRKEIVEREDAGDKLDQMLKEITPQVNDVKKTEKEVLSAHGWRNRKGRSLDILLTIANALPRNEAYLRRFQWSEGKTVNLAGRWQDTEALTRFLRRLNRDPLVEKAEPNSIQRPPNERDAETKGLDVQITVTLREAPAKSGEGETPMKQSEKILAGATAGIIATVGLWAYVAQPTYQRWRDATEREEGLQDKLTRWQALVARDPDIRGERQAIDVVLTPPTDPNEPVDPNDPSSAGTAAITGFLSHLASLTDAAGFKPVTLRYVRADGFDAYAELRFELKARAPLSKIHDFLVKMTASEWYLRAQSLSIAPQTNGEVEADMSLVALAKADTVDVTVSPKGRQR